MSTKFPKKTAVNLLQVVATITELRDRNVLEKTLLITLAELLPVKRITLYRIVPGDNGEEAMIVIEVDAEANIIASRLGMSTPLAQHAEFVGVIESATELVQAMQGKDLFQALYPVGRKHGIIGILEIISAKMTAEDKRIITALLGIYRNYWNLLLESETDTLTGLLNRRTFDSNIGKIIAQRTAPDNSATVAGEQHPARRKAASKAYHWLAIIDIDHFKRVNDALGHLYGDEVLLLMARNMRQIFRQQDGLFRFGGEEFVVVLDRTSLENARRVLERFRKTIEKHNFPQIDKITISIGFVCLEQGEVPSVMVGHADQALYYAKQNGRNQVCQYEELVAAGKLAEFHYSDDLQLF